VSTLAVMTSLSDGCLPPGSVQEEMEAIPQPKGACLPPASKQAKTAGIGGPDFISGYADYADVLEAPRIFHEVTAIQIIATALNLKGVTIPVGALKYSLDLWTVLLSGSGAGRSTTVGLAEPILSAAQMELESSVRWGSAEAFYQHFAEIPYGLHIWGEMAERLKLLNTSQFSTVKEWLTDRYDNFKIPPPHRYRRKGEPGDTPTIDFAQAPRINILATSAEEWFFRNLAEEDSAGGFLARWMIMRADENGRDVPIPRALDASLIPPLAQRLAQIGQLSGPADLSVIEPRYIAWYSEAKRKFEAQSNRALALAYFNRHRGHILKLAVIFEASQSATINVSVAAWERAVSFARRIEESIFKLLPTGMSAAGRDLEKIEDYIRQAGPKGVTQNELTRCFQSMPPKDRAEKIQTLHDAGKICTTTQPPSTKGGRPKTVYVHV
jgi:hypothetical protein